MLRNCDGYQVTEDDVRNLAGLAARAPGGRSRSRSSRRGSCSKTSPACRRWSTWPTMRGAMKRLGGDPKRINPLVPVDLVIDHSVQVDRFGSPEALAENIAMEFQRNRERYEFLRWGQKAFRNFRVVPPARGHHPPGEPGVPGEVRLRRARTRPGRWPCPTRWWAPTATPR